MRVMNVKFVGRIIMTVLFVFICIGAHAGDDPLKYEIEGEGVGAQGIYLVKVTVIQKKSKLDVDVIKKCAVQQWFPLRKTPSIKSWYQPELLKD